MKISFTAMSTGVAVTIMMFVMVFLMPFVDRKICRKLNIFADDRYSMNPQADRYLHIRKFILVVLFLIYIGLLLYVVFFSRSAADDYLLHISFYEDLANAVEIDLGLLGFLKTIFTEGPSAAFSHIRIKEMESVMQVYMNVVMFVPLGYLLPYVFDTFRHDIHFRTIATCFLASVLIENVQLISRLGFYDVDDIFSNTIGGIIGLRFYILFAYYLSQPDFFKELKQMRRYRKRTVSKPIYPFLSKLHLRRTTLFGRNSKEVYDFYVEKLGFRLKRLIPDGEDAYYLFEFGNDQFEVRCSPEYKVLPPQELTIACNNSEHLKKRLDQNGVKTSDYKADAYTDLRTCSFADPDDTMITIIEE